MEDEIDKKENEDEELVPLELAWDMVRFARTLEAGLYGNVLTPDLINARMKDVNYNPIMADQAGLDAALANPKNNEKRIIEFGQGFESVSQPYKRLISYLANLPSYDYTYSVNIDDPKEYDSSAYKKDLKAAYKFFDKFDPKKEFPPITRQIVRNESYFFSIRESENTCILQELPQEYCRITGRWDKGLLFSMNFYWFMLPGVDINMYHPWFKEKFAELFSGGKKIYDPSLSVDMRGNSTWVYYVDIPVSIGWALKFSPETAVNLPYYSPLFSDLLLQPIMRNIQKSKSLASAVRLLYGSIPMLKDQQTKLKDAISLSPELAAKFLTLLKSSVSESVRVGASPLQDVKMISFPAEDDIYAEYVKTTLSLSGVNTALIYTGDVRQNAIESTLSLEIDEQLVTTLYIQYADFMNYMLEKVCKKYTFKVIFEGTQTTLNRQFRMDAATGLASLGMVLPQAFAAAKGVAPHIFLRQLAEAKAMGFVDALTPIVPAAQSSPKDGGRPTKDLGNLGDSGAATRGQGNNIEKKVA